MLMLVKGLQNTVVVCSARGRVEVTRRSRNFLLELVEVPNHDGLVFRRRCEVATGSVHRNAPNPLGVPVGKSRQTVTRNGVPKLNGLVS